MIKKQILDSLSKAMNAWLNLDPESKQRLRKIHGKAITIELLPLQLEFQCLFSENGIDILTNNIMPVDTTLRGTPIQMLGVMLAKENRHQFFAEDVTIEGDAELGQQVVELFDHMQIDWEEYLSKLLGDVPAYHAGRILRKFNVWLGESQKSIQEDVTEYLQEETKWLPSREALNDFFTEIDELRMDVDRIETRIKHLLENEVIK